LYHSHVAPIIDYSCGIWGFQNSIDGEKIQNRATRFYLGIHSKAPILAFQGDIGWNRTIVRHKIAAIRLWNRLTQMSDERLTKKIFNWDHELCKNWSNNVKEILYQIDMHEEFIHKNMCNIDNVQIKCMENDKMEWLNALPLKPKLRTYRTFKREIKTEDYVKYCLNRKRRSLMTQFRIGILPLHIETGRFRNVPEDERKCKVCDFNDIENEFHFLCICNVYNEFRNILYKNVSNHSNNFLHMSDRDKFLYLMEFNWKEVSVYLDKAWEKRTNVLFKQA
jgi:hypothetical protein